MCSCANRLCTTGDVGAGADEDVPQTILGARVAVLSPEARGHRHGIQHIVFCVQQLVADYARLATVQHQTLAQTPTTTQRSL